MISRDSTSVKRALRLLIPGVYAFVNHFSLSVDRSVTYFKILEYGDGIFVNTFAMAIRLVFQWCIY